ncbi:MAG TPA: ABC transporter permease [Balneolaceae bacterium]
MVKNYFKIAFRNLLKRKSFAFLNIFGLAIGIACCLLIALYVLHEISYDEFNTKADRIFRVTQTAATSAKVEKGASTPFPVGSTLENDFPASIAASVRLFDMQEETRTVMNIETREAFLVDWFYFTDSTFFDVFSVNLIHGNPDKALDEPKTVVITPKTARRFFGDENPIGKKLNFKGYATLTVTGVMEPLPPNSHMKIEMLASFSTYAGMIRSTEVLEGWNWNPVWTYVLLEEGVSAEELEEKFPAFAEKNYVNRAEGEELSIGLQAITDIHLHSHLDNEMRANSSILYIYILSAVAILILLIACINFMNLSTARSAERAREVGLRKALGAQREQLFGQFMGESFLMSFLGILAAILLAYLALPWFNELMEKQLSFNFLATDTIVFGLVGLLLVIGLLSGIYPALYLSKFNPTAIMHGSAGSQGGQLLRKSLVVFQFTLSVMLIIGTVVVYLQLQHMQNKKLGFDKEQVVLLPIKNTLTVWRFENFKSAALQSPHILTVTGTNKILGSDAQFYGKYSPADIPTAPPTNMILEVTHDFLDTYKINLVAGRGFSRNHPTDSEKAILINQSMLQQIHAETPRDALDQVFHHIMADDSLKQFQVIGVVEDFYYTSIKKKIKPLVIEMVEGRRPIATNIKYAAVKLAPNSVRDGLTALKEAWEKVNPIEPFTYSFQNEELQKIYASETKMGNMVSVFTLLCILVACLGLFGLASFTASRRTKEIGIRKTLGATVPDIVALLSKNYIKLVLLANIIAWPVIYYLAVQWLQDFPSRIALGWNLVLIFGVAGLLSIVICLATVSYQSIRAALANPVDSIQQE